MCGIVGYIGMQPIAAGAVLDGLTTLEYRGYDSAGIALYDGTQQIAIEKQRGEVVNLRKALAKHAGADKTKTAIGHTRWATHGQPTAANAHPHTTSAGTIAVVHNGIIENYQEIKDKLLAKGYVFASDTDTEIVPHLIDYYLGSSKSLQAAIQKALHDIRGAYALLIMSSLEPDTLYAVRLSSPLVIGLTNDGVFAASDPAAIISRTNKMIYLGDRELIAMHRDGSHEITDLVHSRVVAREAELLDTDATASSRGDYAHFMLKEMHEAPATIRAATQGRIRLDTNTVKLGGLESVTDQLKYIDRIVIVACGTSYYAGLVGEYLIEELAGIPVEVQLASEFKYRDEPFSRSTALLAISQSGETADTIAALKKVENYGVLRLGVVNAVGSTIARMTDAGVYCHAGPEQAVASTKAFIAQVTVLTLIALHLSDGKTPLYRPLLQELSQLATKAETVLASSKAIEKAAKKYAAFADFLFIGRKYGYPCALEGALKLKEVSYIHAEGYAAGEMKHGPLAMIDPKFPTFAIAPDGPLLEKTISNMQEIKARSGPIIAIATEGNKEVKRHSDNVLYIPSAAEQLQPILVALVEQLFAYYVAVERGYNVDRPRNLAKSVTVE